MNIGVERPIVTSTTIEVERSSRASPSELAKMRKNNYVKIMKLMSCILLLMKKKTMISFFQLKL